MDRLLQRLLFILFFFLLLDKIYELSNRQVAYKLKIIDFQKR